MGLFGRHIEISKMVKSGISVGLNKGHVVTPMTKTSPKHSRRIRRVGKSAKMSREIIREVAGFSPYERRIMELLKVSKDKRALKFAKKRLGVLTRGKRKRDEMATTLQKMRKAQASKE